MKSIISKTLKLVALAATLFSFTNSGGEGFEIFLNNKVVIRQFGKSLNEIKSLRLDQNSPDDWLTVKYYHCGQVGKNREVILKNGHDKILKKWHFSDGAIQPAAMNCNVKDILDLNKGGEMVFKLFYSSTDLPNGRLLTNIIVANSSVAKNKQ